MYLLRNIAVLSLPGTKKIPSHLTKQRCKIWKEYKAARLSYGQNSHLALQKLSINQSIALTPRSLRKRPHGGVATADGSPPLPIHALVSCPLQPISLHSPLTHILLHPIFPSSKLPHPPIRTLNTTQIHLLYKFFIAKL